MIKFKVYHLAPLAARRDMGMLGVIYRSVFGFAPKHFHEFFVQIGVVFHPDGRSYDRSHKLQFETFRNGKFLDVIKFKV